MTCNSQYTINETHTPYSNKLCRLERFSNQLRIGGFYSDLAKYWLWTIEIEQRVIVYAVVSRQGTIKVFDLISQSSTVPFQQIEETLKSVIGANNWMQHVYGTLYVFSSYPPPQCHLLLSSKPFQLIRRYMAQRTYGSEKMYWMTYPWPDPRSRLWHW